LASSLGFFFRLSRPIAFRPLKAIIGFPHGYASYPQSGVGEATWLRPPTWYRRWPTPGQRGKTTYLYGHCWWGKPRFPTKRRVT